jgi:integrase
VPLAVPAQEALTRHRETRREDRDFFGIDYQDHGLVFARADGLPLRPDRVTAEFERHAAACGLPQVRLHDTRHGACSLMLAGGVPIEIVQFDPRSLLAGDHASGLRPPDADDDGGPGGGRSSPADPTPAV